MVTFSDYYSQMAAAGSRPRQQPSAMPKYDFSGLSGAAKNTDKPYGVLDTIIDVLSRPLYGVTNAVTGVSEGIADSRESGNPIAAAGGIAAIPTNFLSSFFGTSGEEGKRTFSRVIEEQTDRHGKINDPNYEDIEDNVNPVLKGVLGFVGDVGLDPLTYIPGGLIAKAGSKAASFGKSAVKGVEDAVQARKVVDEAAPAARAVDEGEALLDDALASTPAAQRASAPVRTIEPQELTPGTVSKWASESKIPEVQSAWLDYNRKVERAAGSVSGDVAKGTFLSKTLPDAEKQLTKLYERYNAPVPRVKVPDNYDRTFTEMFGDAVKSPAAEGIRQELTNVLKMVGGEAASTAKQVPVRDWIRQNSKRNLFDAEDVPSAQLSGLLSAAGKTPIGSIARLAEITGRADLPMPIRREADSFIKRFHQRSAAQPSTTVTDALTAFAVRRQQSEDAVRQGLGQDIFNLLERKADGKSGAKAFDKIVRELGRMSDIRGDVSVLDRVSAEARDAFTASLGLPKYVKPEAGTADDVARISSSIHAAQTPADEVLLRTFGSELPIGEGFKKKYVHREGHVAYTEADRELRYGRHVRQLNSMFQYDLNKRLFAAISKRMEAVSGAPLSELKGLQRTQLYRQAFYENWEALSRSLDGLGVKLHVGVGKQEFLPMSFRDVVELTEKGFANEAAALSALFNGGTSIPPSRLMQAVHWVTTTGARGDDALEGVREILRNKKIAGYRGQVLDHDLPNFSTMKGRTAAHFLANGEKAARQFAKDIGGTVTKNPNGGWRVVTGSGGLTEHIAQAVVRVADAYAARAAENSAAYAARGLSEARSLTSSQLARIGRVLSAGTMDEQVEALAKLRAGVQEAGQEIGAFPSSVLAAEDAVKQAVGGFDVQRATYLHKAKTAVDASNVARKPAVAEASTRVSSSTGREADEIVEAGGFEDIVTPGESSTAVKARVKEGDPEVEVYDLGIMDKNYGIPELAGREGATATFLGRKLNEVFNQRYGMNTIFDIYHARKSVAGQYLAETTQALRSLTKFDNAQLNAAVKAVQTGTRNADPAISEAMRTIESVLSRAVDVTPGAKSLLNSPLLRTEPNIDHINAILRQKFGKETDFQFSEIEDFGELANQWRNWQFKEPLKELYALSDAMATVAEHRSIVGNFLHVMGKEGLVSTSYRPGMVKVQNSSNSKFADLIPEGTYLDKNVARELHNLDIMVRTDRKLSGELGEFLQKSFIPAQNIWKQAVTVYRPGHHVRNELSNDFMSFVARGSSYWLRSQKDAMKVLGLSNEYTGANLIDSLTAIVERIPTGTDKIVSGSRHSFTADEIAKLFQDHGLKTTFNISEDLMQDVAQGKLAEIGTKMTNSRVGQLAGSVSHLVDHKGKMQHFIQILHQEATGKGRWGKISKDELVRRAVREVKRSHPDSLMLTPTEAKLRFLIPFYTWFGKTLPFAMESAARNPGRFMTIPKASYNLAVATGINPNNLADPFPDDQLFPSFVTDQFLGPQLQIDGNYINLNPGAPQMDMLETLFTPDPIQGVLGMTSPLLRVPAELATGSRVGGQKINDYSDYIDQNLPLINYLANITGTSVSGSAVSVLQGQGLDPQAQVAKGNKELFDQILSGSNFISGLNAQNWSRPSFINYAEIEKRNRASGTDRSGF